MAIKRYLFWYPVLLGVVRSGDNVFWERSDGRSVGHPQKRWKDTVANDLEKMGVGQWEIVA